MMAILTGVVLMVALGAIAQKSDVLLAAFSRNDRLLPVDDSVSVEAGGSYLIDVLENDSGIRSGDGERITLVSTPACGAMRSENGKIVYAADAQCRGAQTAVYCVQRADACATATLTINLTGPETAPGGGLRIASYDAKAPLRSSFSDRRIVDDGGAPAAEARAGAAPGRVETAAAGSARKAGGAAALPEDPSDFGAAAPRRSLDPAGRRPMPVVAAVAPPREQPPARRDAQAAEPREGVVYASPALTLRGRDGTVASPLGDGNGLRGAAPALRTDSLPAPDVDPAPVETAAYEADRPTPGLGRRLDRVPEIRAPRLPAPARSGATGPQTPPTTPDRAVETEPPRAERNADRPGDLSGPPRIADPEDARFAAAPGAAAPRIPMEKPERAVIGRLAALGAAPGGALGEAAATAPARLGRIDERAGQAEMAARELPDARLAEPLSDATEPLVGPLTDIDVAVAVPAALTAGARAARLIGPRGPDASMPRETVPPAPPTRLDFAADRPGDDGSEPLPAALSGTPEAAAVVAGRLGDAASAGIVAAVAIDQAAQPPREGRVSADGAFALDRVRPAAERSEPLPAALTGVGAQAAAPGGALASIAEEDASGPSIITRIAYLIGAIDEAPTAVREPGPKVQRIERTAPLPDDLARVAALAPEMTRDMAPDMAGDAAVDGAASVGAAAPVRLAALNDVAETDAPGARDLRPTVQREEGGEPLPASLRGVRSFAPLISQRVRLTPDFAGPPRRRNKSRRFAEIDMGAVARRLDDSYIRETGYLAHASDQTAGAASSAGAVETAALRPTASTTALTRAAASDAAPSRPASDPASATLPPVSCDVSLSALPEPGAMIRVQAASECRAGRVAVLRHAGLGFAIRFDAAGRFETMIPAFDRSAALSLETDEGTLAEAGANLMDAARVSRVALVWSDPIDLNLHAFEYGAGVEDPGHVWARSAPNERGFRRGRTGLLQSFPAIDGKGDNIEVYSFNSGRRSQLGVIRMAVEFASRGMTPQEPYCGLSPAASPNFWTLRFENGRLDQRPNQAIVAAPCGEPVDEAAMYLPDLVRDIVIVQK